MAKPQQKHRAGSLEIVPLGGLGEFGMNMMAYRLKDTLLVVDAGVLFPNADTPGVDLLLPDTSYLDAHRDLVKAVVLTHGHEDHIGALPYLLKGFPVPVIGTKLTLGMCRRRLEEHGLLSRIELREAAPGEKIQVGAFRVELIYVSHSLADAVALAIETPFGTVIHTGDFKIDESPPVGPPIHLERFAQLGDRGVLCLLSDSTNAEVPGRTGAEVDVADGFEEVLRGAPGRVLLSCFTSSTHRIQIALDLAQKYGRKAVLVGRSMIDNVGIAIDLGYIRVRPGVLYPVEELEKLPRDEQLVITAGSQGEAMSALSQIAAGTHRFVDLAPGDRVILSARTIPGNERAVNRVVNHLFKLGAEVHAPPGAHVHVSGHGSAEDLAMLLRLVRPEHFVPIHGEFRQLHHHAKIATSNGVEERKAFLAESGDRLRFDADGGRIEDKVPAGRVLVDGTGLGMVDDCVVRDRRRLASAGVLVPMVSMSTSGHLQVSDILSSGFIESEDSEALLAEAHDVMLAALDDLPAEATESDIETQLEASLKRFFRKRSIRRPVILPVVVASEES